MTDTARVADYFARSAEAFDSLYSETAQGPLMRWLNARFRSDIHLRFMRTLRHVERHRIASCLDVGCGSGRYARALHEGGVRRVLGVDLSAPMIELARQHAGDAPGVDFIIGDFADLRTDERFDLVLAMGVFDYIRDPRPTLTKMRSMANHSVLASFPSRHPIRSPIRRVRYRLKRCPVYFYDQDQIAALGRTVGFERTEIEKIPGAGMDYVVAFLR
jgi:SAM-dependent methyltransferase